MHLNGHREGCQFEFSLNYAVGVGRLDGETVERFWAEMNMIVPFLKQMGPGHRVDIFTCIVLDWNWQKTIDMGA